MAERSFVYLSTDGSRQVQSLRTPGLCPAISVTKPEGDANPTETAVTIDMSDLDQQEAPSRILLDSPLFSAASRRCCFLALR